MRTTFDNEPEVSMAGKSLLKKIVEVSPEVPTLHRTYLGRVERFTEFEHELTKVRRHDGRKHFKEWISKTGKQLAEHRAEGQPTENGHLSELEVPQLVFYRKVGKSVSDSRRNEWEPKIT